MILEKISNMLMKFCVDYDEQSGSDNGRPTHISPVIMAGLHTYMYHTS